MSQGSTPDRSGDDDPFSAIPMFAEIARAMSSQGPLNWDAARQFALLTAARGESEPNVDPAVRIQYNELARIAALHVADVTQAEVATPEINVVNRSQWATQTLDAYRHLFTEMATALGAQDSDNLGLGGDELEQLGADDPMMKMLAGFNKMMAPALMGMSVGSMVGSLARRAFGIYDLPIPREPQVLSVIAGSVDQFADDWSLQRDEMRLWVVTHELTGLTLFSAPHIRDRMSDLVRRHAAGFKPDPSAITDTIGNVGPDDNPMEALQRAFNDPEVLLGAVRSPEQRALAPELDAVVAVVVGYLDWVVDAVAAASSAAARCPSPRPPGVAGPRPRPRTCSSSGCSASASDSTRCAAARRSCRASSIARRGGAGAAAVARRCRAHRQRGRRPWASGSPASSTDRLARSGVPELSAGVRCVADPANAPGSGGDGEHPVVAARMSRFRRRGAGVECVAPVHGEGSGSTVTRSRDAPRAPGVTPIARRRSSWPRRQR
ncbi:MAG: zinc-dependent metalloprotease [Ilumatobacteraceae bacterium]